MLAFIKFHEAGTLQLCKLHQEHQHIYGTQMPPFLKDNKLYAAFFRALFGYARILLR